MKKKKLFILMITLLVIVGLIIFFVMYNNRSVNYVLSNDKQEKAIRVGVSKNQGFRIEKDESRIGVVEFWNDEEGYRVEIALRDILQSTYEANLEAHREDDSFNEIEINSFKGYEYSSVSFGRHMYLNLGIGKNDLFDIVYIYVGRTDNYSEGIEEVLELKEVQNILNSLKVVEYVAIEETLSKNEIQEETE